jgi:hypothetical protein
LMNSNRWHRIKHRCAEIKTVFVHPLGRYFCYTTLNLL